MERAIFYKTQILQCNTAYNKVTLVTSELYNRILILSVQKFRKLAGFLNLSLNYKLSSWTDFPLICFCVFVGVLAFQPNCAYKINLKLSRHKLSFYSCLFLEVPVARISTNGFFYEHPRVMLFFIDYLISLVANLYIYIDSVI